MLQKINNEKNPIDKNKKKLTFYMKKIFLGNKIKTKIIK